MIHGRSRRQFVLQTGKIRGSLPAPRRVKDVVAQESHGKHAPAPVALDTAGGMQGEHVKARGIAGFEWPTENGKVTAPRLDVRQIGQSPFGKPFRSEEHTSELQ